MGLIALKEIGLEVELYVSSEDNDAMGVSYVDNTKTRYVEDFSTITEKQVRL